MMINVTRFTLQDRAARRWLLVAALVVVLFMLTGCDKTGQMIVMPRYNPEDASPLFPNGSSAQPIPTGAVPYSTDNISPNDPALTGLDQNGKPVTGFPQPVTKEMVALGQERYNIYCVPCHGKTGEGNGIATGYGMPKPPSYLSDPVKGLANGDIYNVITNGKGKMFSYGYRVKPPERWAIIAYIRALELKNGAVDPNSLTPADLQQLGK